MIHPHVLKLHCIQAFLLVYWVSSNRTKIAFVVWLKIKLTCATLIPVQKLMFPHGCTACSFDSILPVSGVSVVSTSQLLQRESRHLCYHRFYPILNLGILKWIAAYFAMEIRPTLFSGLLRVFEWHTMLTASCWACSRVGRKSPFRMYSLLSTLRKFKVGYLK